MTDLLFVKPLEDVIIYIAAIITILISAFCHSVDVRHVCAVAEASNRARLARQGDDDWDDMVAILNAPADVMRPVWGQQATVLTTRELPDLCHFQSGILLSVLVSVSCILSVLTTKLTTNKRL